MEFREFLSKWLASSGWSLTRFADEVEVSQSLVSKWLHANPRRRVRPSPETIHRLAAVLSIPEVKLLAMLGYFSEGNVPEEASKRVDPELAAVNAVWPRLEEWRKKAIASLAEIGAGVLIDAYLPLPATGAAA